MPSAEEIRTAEVKRLAREAGFARVGIAAAGATPHARAYRNWLSAGFHADMTYLARNVEMRLDPARLVNGAKSVICLAAGYRPREEPHTDAFIARYARGRDYHMVLRRRARALCDRLCAITPDFAGRAFVDTAPVAERDLAASAGLGWVGRNGMLIVPGLGSYVLLAEIVCNLPLCPDEPRPVGCGDCSKCLAACPTGALVAERTVDARRCLSYQTIENRGAIPRALWPKLGSCVFGCDACQAVCPHNRRPAPGDPELLAPADAPPWTLADFLRWGRDDWDRLTRGRALRRASYAMFRRNAILAAGNSNNPALLGLLETLAEDDLDADSREALTWARRRISASTGQ